MYTPPLPDLAASLQLRTQARDLRGALDAAGRELATGQRDDLLAATRGDPVQVFDIDRQLSRLEARGIDLGQAAARTEAAQTALATVQDATAPVALGLLSAISAGDGVSTAVRLSEAGPVLDQVVTTLNTRFGGRTLFAGAAEDGPALADGATLVAAVGAILAAAPDAATARAQVDAYFAPGGGFESNIYLGAATDAASVAVDDDTRLELLPRADDAAIREVLKGLALIAAAPQAGFAGNPAEADALLGGAAQTLQDSTGALVELRGEMGRAEQTLAEARTGVDSQRNMLGRMRNDLVGVDAYDAASRFAELEGQLQALYTVTARLSGLKLTNFLR